MIKKIMVLILLCNGIAVGMEQLPAKQESKNSLVGLLEKVAEMSDIQSHIERHMVGRKQYWHEHLKIKTEMANSLSFGAGGQLAIGCMNRKIQIIDSISGNVIKKILFSDEHDDWIGALCFDKEGKRLAVGGGSNAGERKTNIRIFDIASSDSKVENLSYGPYQIESLQFDPTGKYIASMANHLGLRLLDVESNAGRSFANNYKINAICFNQGGQITIADEDGDIQICEVSSSNVLKHLSWNGCDICFDEIGKYFATTENDSIGVKLCGVEDGKVVTEIPYNDIVYRFNKTGDLLVVGSWKKKGGNDYREDGDYRLCIVEIPSGEIKMNLPHFDWVEAVCFDRTRKILATCEGDEVHVFMLHEAWTTAQILLMEMLYNWLVIEKPDKAINNLALPMDHIFADVAEKFAIPQDWARTVMMTFPEKVRLYAWEHMSYLIDKFGKEEKRTDDLDEASDEDIVTSDSSS